MEDLYIEDLDKLKITSVKQWSINFNYDGQRYFLHDDSDEDCCIGLYHKTSEGNVYISGKITSLYIPDFVKTVTNSAVKYNQDCKMITPLSQINKKYFVYTLNKQGLVKSLYDDIIQEKNNLAKTINERIDYLKFQIDDLKKDINAIQQPPDFIYEKDPYIPKGNKHRNNDMER